MTFEKLLQAVALGNTEPEVLSSVAARLARMERQLPPEDQEALAEAAGGLTLQALAGSLVRALDPDVLVAAASRRWSEVEAASRRLEEQLEAAHFFNPYAAIDMREATLPHWRQEGVTYFVTFRLADSLPAEKIDPWRRERQEWLNKHPEPWKEKRAAGILQPVSSASGGVARP